MAKRYAEQVVDKNWRKLVRSLLNDPAIYLTGHPPSINILPDGWPYRTSRSIPRAPRGTPPDDHSTRICVRCRKNRAAMHCRTLCKQCLEELTTSYCVKDAAREAAIELSHITEYKEEATKLLMRRYCEQFDAWRTICAIEEEVRDGLWDNRLDQVQEHVVSIMSKMRKTDSDL